MKKRECGMCVCVHVCTHARVCVVQFSSSVKLPDLELPHLAVKYWHFTRPSKSGYKEQLCQVQTGHELVQWLLRSFPLLSKQSSCQSYSEALRVQSTFHCASRATVLSTQCDFKDYRASPRISVMACTRKSSPRSFSKYLLSIYYIPGTMLGMGA